MQARRGGGSVLLIAGHRGAGKTALVLQVIEVLRSEPLRKSVQPDPKQRQSARPVAAPDSGMFSPFG